MSTSESLLEILLIEDDPRDAELTLNALRENNIINHVKTVSDGAEALDFIFCKGDYSHRSPDNIPKFILLDLKLPKIDGLEVLQILKSDPKTKNIPIVVLTSSSEERDIVESYKLGVNSYIVKPIDFQQFTHSVRQLGLYWMIHNITPNANP